MEDEDIKTVEEFMSYMYQSDEKEEFEKALAIENLLSRLKTAERMNDVLADELESVDNNVCRYLNLIDKCKYTCPSDQIKCVPCIKEWARKKVEENV